MVTKKVDDKAAELHRVLAEMLLGRLRSVQCEHCGATGASAAELNVARQFLKDNGIDFHTVNPEEPIQKLAAVLPFKSPEGLIREG
jgi:hypothetical protein